MLRLDGHLDRTDDGKTTIALTYGILEGRRGQDRPNIKRLNHTEENS
jgi:hypothetical protein